MFTKQRGSALAISLSLLLIITIVGVAGATNSFLGERQAANQKQIFDALMAAERGLVNAKNWFDNPVNNADWGDEPAALAGINALFGNLIANEVSWAIQSVTFNSNNATIVSCGTIVTTGVNRCLTSIYQQGSGGGDLAPFVINNLLNEDTLRTADSGRFEAIGQQIGVDSEGNPIYGPAIATNTEENKQLLIDDIMSKRGGDGRMDQYMGGVEVVNYDGAFGDPELMNEFVQSIKAQWEAMSDTDPAKGFAPAAMGTSANPKITYHAGDLALSGNCCIGAGTLVVNGNLKISGNNFRYEGLIVVTGTSFELSGGGNKEMVGSIVFANPVQDESGDWTFGGVEAVFDFDVSGGAAQFVYDKEALQTAHRLLNENAQSLWNMENEAGEGGARSSRMFAWGEYNP